MLSLYADIWPCVAAAALLGVFAGWLVWGRETKAIVASYRRRVAKARANWEAVEERLTQALAHASALEKEQESFQREWTETQVAMREKEEAWNHERRLLEDTLRRLNQRLLVVESKPRPSPAARPKRDLGQ
jgi:chromosome segregation ATPase